MHRKQNGASALLSRWLPALLLTAGVFCLTYAVVFRFRSGDSDYIDHAIWALAMSPEDMLDALTSGDERLWHILVKLLFTRTHNMWTAAAAVTAAANAAAALLVYLTLEEALPRKGSGWAAAALTAAVFTANAITWPGVPMASDRGYFNPWHNPTSFMVRPFAAAVFFMTLRILNRRRSGLHAVFPGPEADAAPYVFADGFAARLREPVYTKAELVLYPLCILLSVYAKPSFLQYFAPAIFLFCVAELIRTKGKIFPFCLKLALAYLPAVIIILMQFFSYFGGFSSAAEAQAAAEAVQAAETVQASAAEAAAPVVMGNGFQSGGGFNDIYVSSGIAVYWILPAFSGAGEFLAETGRALLLTLYLCAFPLAVLLIDGGSSAAARLGLWGLLTARLESLLIHELGARATHGNFRWAYFIAVWLLWAAAAERFAARLRTPDVRGKLMRFIAAPLLLWQLAGGVIYIIRILQTGQYWY